jgi:hypothetical protein
MNERGHLLWPVEPLNAHVLVWRFERKPDVYWMTNINAGDFLVEAPGPSIMDSDRRMAPWSIWAADGESYCGIFDDWAEELFLMDAAPSLAALVDSCRGRLDDNLCECRDCGAGYERDRRNTVRCPDCRPSRRARQEGGNDEQA